MTINLHLPSQIDTLRPKITVVGVGGAGGNAVNNMIAANLEGVDFVIANTDAQALESAQTDRVIQLGLTVTRGLGAGAKPQVGLAAAEEAMEEIADYIHGSNMVFITAGMGGGTGTGAAPVIARLAKEQGMLTVGVVTKPFQFEGAHRMKIAEAGIRELQQYVDTLIVVPNQNLFRIANEKTTFAEAFRLADEVLHSGVRGVTDLIVKPGLVNLDFADIRAVMSEMGKAMMGTGEATGDQRALQASEAAISNPLLDDVSLKGARAVLVNITGGQDMSLFEVDEAVNRIRDEVDPEANIIFGSTFSDTMEGKMRVSVVATGIDADQMLAQPPHHDMVPTMPSARKPFMGGTTQAPRKDHSMVGSSLATRERSPAEIVRQAGTSSVIDTARAPAPRAAAPAQPVIRIIDESARTQDEQHKLQAQQAAAAAAAQAAQLENAMRIAANAARPAVAEQTMEEAGPLFVSPRAEVPQQRTLFSSQAPDAQEGDDEAAGGKSLFNRLANVGKSFTGTTRAPSANPRAAASAAAPERKAEVRERAPHASDEEEFYDIPAFLRRQAN
ncbi:MAG: cell division protein FtsZ [Pseudomonadota bacterium]